MRRDHALYELSDDEFESLVVKICIYWLGEGVTPFAAGRDGGRDGKFHGKANCFPSEGSPLEGHVVLQAKHASAPDKSCSDPDFGRLLKKEFPQIKRLIKDGLCDHYILFTNRKYTGGADEKLIKSLTDLGLKSAHIIGVERLHTIIETRNDIRASLPNLLDQAPFHFDPNDLEEVIGALHEYVAGDDEENAFHSASDFEKLKITEKNAINGVSHDYYLQIIRDRSMPHFDNIGHFLKNPRNRSLADLYHDAADELKEKILITRAHFTTFDDVFGFLCQAIQGKSAALKGRRRLVSILLHYMYCNCDIGSKEISVEESRANADA